MVLGHSAASSRVHLTAVLSIVLGLLATAPNAFAVPSFARQTGMPCTQCHVGAFGPVLTAFGRTFKLTGYTLGSGDAIPLSAMAIGSFTNTDKKLPEKAADHFSDNNNAALDEVGLFYAGKITEHIGTFTQVTYDGISRDTSWDNMDTRYATTTTLFGRAAVVGVTVNNSPTTQDLWNSTPVWSYPYVGSGLAPTPAASALISDGLGQQVIGTGAYTMLDDHLYLEAGAYHAVPNDWLDRLAGTSLDSPRPHNLIPYWRAAYQMTRGLHYLSAGVFGLSADLQPDGSVSGSNGYVDYGTDATYQYNDGTRNAIDAHVSYIREDQHLRQSFNAGEVGSVSNQLNTLKLDAAYTWKQTWTASAGWFDTEGSRDSLVYAPNPVDGSLSGRPDSRGYTLQVQYVPWGKQNASVRDTAMNAQVGLQYTGYNRFNGRSSNYDGFDRSASDNNTLFLFLWLAF